MSNKIIIGILVLVSLSAWYIFSESADSKDTSITGEVVALGAQKVVLSQDKSNYKDITAKAGNPIVITADSSVKGCLRSVSFNIEGKGYSKYLQTSEDTLELPALSKGVYTFSCSMGMGFGKLIIQ